MIVDPLLLAFSPGCCADIEAAGHTLASTHPAEVGVVAVQLGGDGITPIHILGDDWLPLIVEKTHQLIAHIVVVDGHRAGHDQQIFAVAVPEAFDGECQQPQHTAGALEAIQGAPFLVEPVEQLGVNGIGRCELIAIAGFTRFSRELSFVHRIEIGEGTHHRIA